MCDQPQEPHELRSYGRRRARALSPRQAALWRSVLPRLEVPREPERLADPPGLFNPRVREVWLEIGFGGGEHLLWQAQQHPDVGLIGCEPFENGIVKVLAALETSSSPNIRLHPQDARMLLRWLPEACIGRAFILFPDPWPKKRHQKRRLVAPATLGELARVMRAGSELRIATDITEYARAILSAVRAQGDFQWTAQHPLAWRRRGADWPATRYEQKALREGRRCAYFRFRRR
jgi:tRNA (guanine-N7-)-methyltransferase